MGVMEVDEIEAVGASTNGADARGRRRAREPSTSRQPHNTCWSIVAPKGRHIAICATCHSDIPSRMPRVRHGEGRSRVNHVGCVAALCGDPQFLSGWTALDDHARTTAAAQFDSSGVRTMTDAGRDLAASDHKPEDRVLQKTEFWGGISWRSLHDPVRSMDCVPLAIRPALAELRASVSAAVNASLTDREVERYLKCFFSSTGCCSLPPANSEEATVARRARP